MSEHIILVAFEVSDETREGAEQALTRVLHDQVLASNGGPAECWWVAEDERHDGSDNDSAVFVTPGLQGLAAKVLNEHHLTPEWNLIPDDRSPGPWEGLYCLWGNCGDEATGFLRDPNVGLIPVCTEHQGATS